MKNWTTAGGCQIVTHPDGDDVVERILQEASFGSGLVWVGDFILDRDEVAAVVAYLSHWLSTGRLFTPDATESRA